MSRACDHPATVGHFADGPRRKSLPEEGLEPTLSCENGILNPARLPIPPLRRVFLT